MVKRNLVNKKRGRPKGSKNKPNINLEFFTKRVGGTENQPIYSVSTIPETIRYSLKSRTEKNELDADQDYYFIYDLNRGDIYPELIARFTVETEAKLCTEYLNGIRKISKKEYEKKRICIL